MVNEKAPISIDGTLLEDVNTFKYIDAKLTSDGVSDNELRIRLSTRKIWNSKNITFHVKFNLYNSLILSILLYGCETWTIMEREEKNIQAFDNKAQRILLCITYRQHKINKYIQEIVLNQIGKYEPTLAL